MRFCSALSIVLVTALIGACGERGADQPASPVVAPEPVQAPAPQAGPVVRVHNWEEYMDPEILEQFTAETGLQVDYQTFVGNEDLQALLDANEPFADVVFPSALPYARDQVQGRQLQALSESVRAQLSDFDATIMRAVARADPSGNHLVPYLWGTTGIGMNVAKVRAALGADVALDTWDLLFDPQYTERLQGCGIALQAEKAEIIGAAMLAYDPAAFDSQLTEFVLERTLVLSLPHIRYFAGSTRIINDLSAGNICIALAWSGDVQQAVDRAEQEGTGQEIAYVVPREGALVWVDVMAIPANATNPEGGQQFIEFMIRPEILAKASNYVAYASARPAAEAFVDPSVLENPTIYPSAEVRQRLYGIPSVQPRHRASRDEVFERIVVESNKWITEEEEVDASDSAD